jgi:hypothetical protein
MMLAHNLSNTEVEWGFGELSVNSSEARIPTILIFTGVLIVMITDRMEDSPAVTIPPEVMEVTRAAVVVAVP